MKRTVASIGIVFVAVTLVSTGFGRTERVVRSEGVTPAQAVREPPAERSGAERAQQAQKLQQQLEEMRAAHQNLIDALNAIRTTAMKEGAGLTVKQIETLITKQQTAFQDDIRDLQQQLQQLQASTRSRPARPEASGPRVRRAPEFELDSFDGSKFKLSDYKDQIVVLEWLNPECPYSKFHYETVHTMVDTAKKYRSQGVIWLAINSTLKTPPEVSREFAEKYKLPYPILDDRSGEVARRYGARMTPHIFIIDKEGRIAYEGAIDNAPRGKDQPSAGKTNYVDKALAELTLNRKVSIPSTAPYGSPIRYGR